MSPERIRQAEAISKALLAQEGDSAGADVDDLCGGDGDLIARVSQLLQEAGGFTQTFGSRSAAVPVRTRYDDMSGHRVGHYQLERRVGKGGMGSVYAAHRVDEYQKLVAVKTVRPGMETDEVLRRFRTERQVLASLEHPNISRLLDGGSTDDGMPYLVMEYVEGTPIDQYCGNHQLSIQERLQLFCCVCAAVQYAHQNLVIHRDLKSSNILVTSEGIPKLLDFGIAKLLRPEYKDEAFTTSADHQPYTPEFASPEQIRGEAVTTATDVYSLGVLLYRLLTGRRPYVLETETAKALMYAILEQQPAKPSLAISRFETFATGLHDEVPAKSVKQLKGDLDMIALMALRKEPQRRYSSVQHLAEDVQRHLQGLPVRAQRDTVGYRTSKFVLRHKAAVSAAAIVVVALILSTVVSLVYYQRAVVAQRRSDSRFNDVRELARFVLFDFDRAIVAGTTPARKALVERALDYLRRIEAEPGRDASLTSELVDGYLKMGDLQGNLLSANLGDATAAKTSYESALRIAQSARPRDPKRVAAAQVKLADLLVFSGQRKEAVGYFRAAYKLFERDANSDPEAARTLTSVLRSTAFAEYQMGDLQAALKDYTASLELARRFTKAHPGRPELRRELALGLLRTGEMQARLGNVAGGLPLMKEALDGYEQAAQANPESAGARRNIVMTCMLIGDALTAARDHTEAARFFRRGLELNRSLSAADPQNEQFRRDLHNGLGRLADALAKTGQREEARSLTREALSILRPLAQRRDASQYDLQQYAWLLVATPVQELRDPALGRIIAENLVERTKGQDAAVLDLLARALAGSGELERAEDTERKALSLLPPGTNSDLRAELEANLIAFRTQAGMKRARTR